ncbi:MAG: tetratricopeptide repeat protein, partial [Gammaproteobacteria bacterium]|nr:tetratricopeptide repeat protein [Gammaproteobacteria bacterium]NIR85513.1 tetratricopeptide repeat protein [Gammaproteobacteria bacterium]NIU06648.1 tetratricopeptide repeat protein [Gammaproteobacteria bacterium]NIX87921.1 tetratricopeptide repeat protein [Gammaproteobacteria bacterium]
LLGLPDRDSYITLLAGLIDVSLEDWKAAEPRLAAAAERLPQRTEAWMGLGHTRLALGDPEAAAQAYRRALELQPRNAAVWNDLGIANADMRRDHDAIA